MSERKRRWTLEATMRGHYSREDLKNHDLFRNLRKLTVGKLAETLNIFNDRLLIFRIDIIK